MTEKYEFDYSGENALFSDGKSSIREVKNGTVSETAVDIVVQENAETLATPATEYTEPDPRPAAQENAEALAEPAYAQPVPGHQEQSFIEQPSHVESVPVQAEPISEPVAAEPEPVKAEPAVTEPVYVETMPVHEEPAPAPVQEPVRAEPAPEPAKVEPAPVQETPVEQRPEKKSGSVFKSDSPKDNDEKTEFSSDIKDISSAVSDKLIGLFNKKSKR